jgi:hypothetical protein
MNKDDVSRIVKLREYIIKEYNRLESVSTAPNALMKQSEAALTLETIVRSIDDLIKENVNFS